MAQPFGFGPQGDVFARLGIDPLEMLQRGLEHVDFTGAVAIGKLQGRTLGFGVGQGVKDGSVCRERTFQRGPAVAVEEGAMLVAPT